jgi:hypothetical protein
MDRMDLTSPATRARILLALLPLGVAAIIVPTVLLFPSRTSRYLGPYPTREQVEASKQEDFARANRATGIMLTTVVGVGIASFVLSVLDKRTAKAGRPNKQE